MHRNMTKTQYIKLRVEDTNPWRWEPVQILETFGELKLRVLSTFSGNHRRMSMHFRIELQFSSAFRKPRLAKIPQENDLVVDVMLREEGIWPGCVCAVIVDTRTGSLLSTLRPVELSSDIVVANNHAQIDCTEGIQECRMIDVPESLLEEISNAALFEGKLKKRVALTGKQDQFRDEYIFLDRDRLWYLDISQWDRNVKQISYVDLNVDSNAVIYPGLPMIFSVNLRDGDNKPIILKAMSKQEATAWVAVINSRYSYDLTNNELLADIESSIQTNEFRKSKNDIDTISLVSNFEGTLENRFLRDRFRQNLSKQSTNALLLWERATDYKYGNPGAADSFIHKKFGGSNIISKDFTIAWAATIFNDFFVDGTLFAIPAPATLKLSPDEFQRQKLKSWNAIKAYATSTKAEYPSALFFEYFQSSCFSYLASGPFADFVASKSYRKLLVAAVVMTTQVLRGEVVRLCTVANTSESFYDSSGLQKSVGGMGEIVSAPSPTSAAAAAGPRKPSMIGGFLRSMTSSAKAGDTMGTRAAPTHREQIQPTPWRSQSLEKCRPGDLWLPQSWWTEWAVGWVDKSVSEDASSASTCSPPSPDWLPSQASAVEVLQRQVDKWFAVQARDHEFRMQTLRAFKGKNVFAGRAAVPATAAAAATDPPVPPVSLAKYSSEAAHRDRNKEGGTQELQAADGDVFRQIAPYIQPSNGVCACHTGASSLIPGGISMGLVVITGLADCKHHRRSGRTAGTGTPVAGARVRSTSTPAAQSGPSSFLRTTLSAPVGASAPADESLANSPGASRGDMDSEGNRIGVEGFVRFFCVMAERLGHGVLYFLDQTDYAVNFVTTLDRITEVCASPKILHGIDLHDSTGLRCQLIPTGVDEEDSRIISARWLSYFGAYCRTGAVTRTVLCAGVLAKRGQLNTAFKKRWFVLYSDHQLRYYKDGVHKGSINLNHVPTVSANISETGSSIFRRADTSVALTAADPQFWKQGIVDIVLWTTGRGWVLQAESGEEGQRWYSLMNHCVSWGSTGGANSAASEEDDDED